MSYAKFNATSVEPLKDGIIVTDMKFENTLTKGGIILLDDNSKEHGIHPRWAKVYAVGPTQTDVKVGQWVLISHGRWTRGATIVNPNTQEELIIRKIDPKDLMLVSNIKPEGE